MIIAVVVRQLVFIQLIANLNRFLNNHLVIQGLFDLPLVINWYMLIAHPVESVKKSSETFFGIATVINRLPILIPKLITGKKS